MKAALPTQALRPGVREACFWFFKCRPSLFKFRACQSGWRATSIVRAGGDGEWITWWKWHGSGDVVIEYHPGRRMMEETGQERATWRTSDVRNYPLVWWNCRPDAAILHGNQPVDGKKMIHDVNLVEYRRYAEPFLLPGPHHIQAVPHPVLPHMETPYPNSTREEVVPVGFPRFPVQVPRPFYAFPMAPGYYFEMPAMTYGGMGPMSFSFPPQQQTPTPTFSPTFGLPESTTPTAGPADVQFLQMAPLSLVPMTAQAETQVSPDMLPLYPEYVFPEDPPEGYSDLTSEAWDVALISEGDESVDGRDV